MAHSLFVSDLHLCPSRPALAGIFFDFLRGAALRADALYILGDLFEYWAGDDDDTDFKWTADYGRGIDRFYGTTEMWM